MFGSPEKLPAVTKVLLFVAGNPGHHPEAHLPVALVIGVVIPSALAIWLWKTHGQQQASKAAKWWCVFHLAVILTATVGLVHPLIQMMAILG